MADLEARLEEETERYAELCEEAAEAEADWKERLWTATVEQAAEGGRSNEKLREAQASLRAGTERYRLYLLVTARQRATAAALRTLERRLDYFRTLSANVRGQT